MAVLALIGGVVAIGASPSGAAFRWSVSPSPSPAGPPAGDLSGVTCATPTSCFAVGAGVQGTLIERWDGAVWSIVPSPSPVASGDDGEIELNDVACSSAVNCFAVGDTAVSASASVNAKTLIERWNGTSWRIVPSPTPKGATATNLFGVSCPSTTSCFAVGDTSTSTTGESSRTFVERWNGSSWKVLASANPAGNIQTKLSGVSCASPTSCFAVGDFVSNSDIGGIIERWDGASWKVAASPDPDSSFAGGKVTNAISSFDTFPGLTGVSCSSPTSCFAVGVGGQNGGLVEQWDGTAWTILPSQKPHGQEVEFDAVSCSSATDCFLVGSSEPEISADDDPISQPLIEHWDGTGWTIAANAGAGGNGELLGVACASTTSCAAIGDTIRIEHWDGSTWSLAPLVSVTSQSRFNSVSCPTTTSCFAVGTHETRSRSYALIEHWNGRSWKVIHSANPVAGFFASLVSVSCVSASRCIAVGSDESTRSQHTLVERWNGTSWAIVASPNPPGAEVAELNGVSCVSSTNCTAVGLELSRSGSKPLIEHWNGTTWSVAATPASAGGVFADLIGVSCPSATSCNAVGIAESIGGRPPKITITSQIEHWDGHVWTAVPTNNIAGAELIGVSCYSVTHCLAVGITASLTGPAGAPVVARLNGGQWSTVPTPKPKGAMQTGLSSVSCRSAASCYAVGSSSTASATTTLVEHWNGAKWSIVASANPGGTSGSNLNAVSCPSNTSCTAVGDYTANDGFFTLAERGK